LQRSLADALNITKLLQQGAPPSRSNSRYALKAGRHTHPATGFAVRGNGKTVRLITDALQQVKTLRMSR
jgi:hypothetical protein